MWQCRRCRAKFARSVEHMRSASIKAYPVVNDESWLLAVHVAILRSVDPYGLNVVHKASSATALAPAVFRFSGTAGTIVSNGNLFHVVASDEVRWSLTGSRGLVYQGSKSPTGHTIVAHLCHKLCAHSSG